MPTIANKSRKQRNPAGSQYTLSDDFRTVFGPGACKQLARVTQVHPGTVKRWFSGDWPAARQNELQQVLVDAIEQRRRLLDEIRSRL